AGHVHGTAVVVLRGAAAENDVLEPQAAAVFHVKQSERRGLRVARDDAGVATAVAADGDHGGDRGQPVRTVGDVVDLGEEHGGARGACDDVRPRPGRTGAHRLVAVPGRDGVAVRAPGPAGGAAGAGPGNGVA